MQGAIILPVLVKKGVDMGLVCRDDRAQACIMASVMHPTQRQIISQECELRSVITDQHLDNGMSMLLMIPRNRSGFPDVSLLTGTFLGGGKEREHNGVHLLLAEVAMFFDLMQARDGLLRNLQLFKEPERFVVEDKPP